MPRCPICFSLEGNWTDDPILTKNGLAGEAYTGFTFLKATHIQELQNVRRQEEIDVGIPVEERTTFTEIVGHSLNIQHIIELRNSTEQILEKAELTKDTYFNYDEEGNEYNIGNHQSDWRDSDLINWKGHIRAVHIEDLRHLILFHYDFMERWINPSRSWSWVATEDTNTYNGVWVLDVTDYLSFDVTEDVGLDVTLISPDTYRDSFVKFGYFEKIPLRYKNSILEINATPGNNIATSSLGRVYLSIRLYLNNSLIGSIRYSFVWNHINWGQGFDIDVSARAQVIRNLTSDFRTKFGISEDEWNDSSRKIDMIFIIGAGEYYMLAQPYQFWGGTTQLHLGKMYLKSRP